MCALEFSPKYDKYELLTRNAGVKWKIPVFLQTPGKLLWSQPHHRGRGGPDVGSSPVAGDVISAERPIFIKGKKKIKDPFNPRLR